MGTAPLPTALLPFVLVVPLAAQDFSTTVGDLDGDGRPDIVEANDCGTNAVHLWR